MLCVSQEILRARCAAVQASSIWRTATIYLSFLGDPDDCEALLRPLRAQPLVSAAVSTVPGVRLTGVFAEPTHPHPYQGDSVAARGANPDALETELAHLASPQRRTPAFVFVHHLAGALRSPAAPVNAVGHRDADYLIRAISTPAPGFDPNTLAAEHDRGSTRSRSNPSAAWPISCSPTPRTVTVSPRVTHQRISRGFALLRVEPTRPDCSTRTATPEEHFVGMATF
ncbi:hypothetical protein [Nocardia africana]|nr:hypothetical protein [Nocardia africana]MCC3312320.1 hypothetical protein [Nocardia africana]